MSSIHVQDIAKSSKEDIDNFDLLLLGIPTWYYGEAQCDWDDFFPELEQIDFSTKLVAIFGCGDQEDYAEYFCDAMGTVRDIVESKGGTILGHTKKNSLVLIFGAKQCNVTPNLTSMIVHMDFTLPTADILSGKNARAWISMDFI